MMDEHQDVRDIENIETFSVCRPMPACGETRLDCTQASPSWAKRRCSGRRHKVPEIRNS